jgi:proteasome alpha subunit
MTEEPYRWLEAVANRREYVREHLKGGSPAFAVSLADGILLLGVGAGRSKVFELFDRHALAGLGHPADLERIRQAAIDAAHVEGFTRAPEDVSLRRLVGFGLSGQLKTHFEQIYSAPFLVELLLAELGPAPGEDVLVRLHFDGGFEMRSGGVVVASHAPEAEAEAVAWLDAAKITARPRAEAADLLLQAWWCVGAQKPMIEGAPSESERRTGWREAITGRVVELGWLARHSDRRARYECLTLESLGVGSEPGALK